MSIKDNMNILMKSIDLNDFLKKHRVRRGQSCTHTSLSGGSYNIQGKNHIKFVELFVRTVNEGGYYGTAIQQVIPKNSIFKLFSEIDGASQKQLKKIIKYTIRYIKEIFEIEEDEEVTYKLDKNDSKEGHYHIFWEIDEIPIICNKHVAKHIGSRIIEKFPDWAKIVDCNYAGLRVPGACKYNKKKNEYILSRYFPNEGLSYDSFMDRTLFGSLNKSTDLRPTKLKIKDGKTFDIDFIEKFRRPTSLSFSHKRTYPIKKRGYTFTNQTNKFTEKMTPKIVKEIISNLSSKRSDSYEDWIKIVWALKTLGDDYRDIAIDFSKKSSKYDPSDFDSNWYRGKTTGYLIRFGTIMYMLKEDIGKEKYEKKMTKWFPDIYKKKSEDYQFIPTKKLKKTDIMKQALELISNNKSKRFC